MKENKIFDDFAKMASSATGTIFDMKREVEAMVSAQVEKFLLKMHFVRREEFEAVKEMAAKARAEAEILKERLDSLEKAKASPKKPTTKS